VTKAIYCTHCDDILSPYRDWRTNRAWRWCQCDHAATRWRDGAQGLIEVTAVHGPDFVRVLGISNMFLGIAVQEPEGGGTRTVEQWRKLHELCATSVDPYYLFHEDNRNCWALVVRVGESGDVIWVDGAEAWQERVAADASPP
jgi:hypothetical protein